MMLKQTENHSELLCELDAEIVCLFRSLTDDNKKDAIYFAQTLLASEPEAAASDLVSSPLHTA